MPILKLFTPTFTSPSFRTGGVIYIIQIVLINVSCDSFTISKPYETLFWSFCYHHRLLCSLMHTLQKATSPIFKILWCVALSLGQHFLWAHALDFPWLDAWLETLGSRILSHHKWKVLSKLCWKCYVIALTKSVNVILKLLDGWLLSLIGLDVFPTSPN